MSLYKEYKYISMSKIEDKPKTQVYEVQNIHSGDPIGQVKWFANWRQYCFFPEPECVFSKGCMDDINKFIGDLMQERKTIQGLGSP